MTIRDDNEMRVNPGYAGLQLAKALLAADRSDDTATQERARARAENWQRVFENIADGTVDYGSVDDRHFRTFRRGPRRT